MFLIRWIRTTQFLVNEGRPERWESRLLKVSLSFSTFNETKIRRKNVFIQQIPYWCTRLKVWTITEWITYKTRVPCFFFCIFHYICYSRVWRLSNVYNYKIKKIKIPRWNRKEIKHHRELIVFRNSSNQNVHIEHEVKIFYMHICNQNCTIEYIKDLQANFNLAFQIHHHENWFLK